MLYEVQFQSDSAALFRNLSHLFILCSVFALIPPEEESDCAGTCMASDRCSDAVYDDFSVQLREMLFDEISDCSCVFEACGVGDIAFSGVIRAVFCMLDHLINDRFDDLFLCADLIARDQPTLIIDIHERADVEEAADEAGGL